MSADCAQNAGWFHAFYACFAVQAIVVNPNVMNFVFFFFVCVFVNCELDVRPAVAWSLEH